MAQEDHAMTYRSVISLLGLVSLLVAAPAAFAQPLEVKTPPAKPEKVTPTIPDRDLRPAQPAVPYKPGFIAPFTKQTPTGRVGIAGWTAPNLPAGSRGAAEPESSGVAGFGFAAEWSGMPGRSSAN
jgi:hypothetical protein